MTERTDQWPRRVLITGAAGAVGSVLRAGFQGLYKHLRLTDISPLEDPAPGEEIMLADMRDMAALTPVMADVDCVVHLAGLADEDNWEKVSSLAIDGCYTVFEAARLAGVKRIVYASSNHAIGFHPRSKALDLEVPLRPDGRYGLSNAFGELLGRLYADKYGMSIAAVRIGSFRPKPEDRRQLMTWLSHRDAVQLFRRCVEHPGYHYVCVYGVSANRDANWDNSQVDWLGYQPQDNAADYEAEILAQPDDEDAIAKALHGGRFCSDEFDGDLTKIR
ncbi:MAG: NAD-dependent epimerase/dehydratase family protein [Sphingomonadales bacterium]